MRGCSSAASLTYMTPELSACFDLGWWRHSVTMRMAKGCNYDPIGPNTICILEALQAKRNNDVIVVKYTKGKYSNSRTLPFTSNIERIRLSDSMTSELPLRIKRWNVRELYNHRRRTERRCYYESYKEREREINVDSSFDSYLMTLKESQEQHWRLFFIKHVSTFIILSFPEKGFMELKL